MGTRLSAIGSREAPALRLVRCSDGLVLCAPAHIALDELLVLADDPHRAAIVRTYHVRLPDEDVELHFGFYAGAEGRDPSFAEGLAIVSEPLVLRTATPLQTPWAARLRAMMALAVAQWTDTEIEGLARLGLAHFVPETVVVKGDACLICGQACERRDTRVCARCGAATWDQVQTGAIRAPRLV